jgi:two-component system nitrogen regulation sensor histidine kinase GlnL
LAARWSPRLRAATPPSVAPPWVDVLASIEDAVVVLDAGHRITDLNPAAEQLIGVSAPQGIGKLVGDVFHTSPWVTDMARETLREGAARHRGEGMLVARRHEVPVSATCAPIVDSEGQRRGAVLVLHDLTLQRTLEATTRRADRLAALGTIAQGLAHEIRNPLGGIKGAAQLLRPALSDAEHLRATDIIVREVERLDGLVEQLRELATPPRLRLEPVNIHRVLNDVLVLQRQAASWGDVALRTSFDPSLPAIRGDRGQLTQVFLNLVKNALEALAGTGELSVSTRIESHFHIRRASGRGLFLSVLIEDSGPGIPEADQPQLFAPFFSTKARGSGLGLAVCHRIVTEHGGTIAYEDHDGHGACFRVTLPIEDEDSVAGG